MPLKSNVRHQNDSEHSSALASTHPQHELLTMNPDIFLDDFERTEHSDALHGMLGRALIVATRFDAMCKAAALQVEFRKETVSLGDEKNRHVFRKPYSLDA